MQKNNGLEFFQLDQKCQLVFEHSPLLIAYFDKNERCLLANDNYLKFRNLPTEDIVGRTLQQSMARDVYAIIKPNIDPNINSKMTKEFNFIRKTSHNL